MRVTLAGLIAVLVLIGTGSVHAATATQAEIDALKKDVEELRRKVNANSSAPVRGSVDQVLENKYGPNAPVTTRIGKLQMGGLVQIWYYSIQNDNRGLFDDANGTGVVDTNEASDNDSFRVRRAELNFTMDIHENVTAYVMIDPAREATSFPGVTPGFKHNANVAPEFDSANGPFNGGTTGVVAGVQQGSGAVPNLLQDALINFHGVVPHHDFTVGQYLPTFSEEDFRPNSLLDFVERSFIGNQFARELGATIHGSWWNNGGGGPYCGGGDSGRFQYWLSVFDGAGNYHQTGGQSQNRSDDNDEKDLLGTILVRPLWGKTCGTEKWGNLELGASAGWGKHGEAGGSDPVSNPVNGLNRTSVQAMRYSAWASYHAGGPMRGFWMKGEWAWVRDRNAPGTVIDQNANDPNGIGFQTNGKPFSTEGWYAAIGYKLSDSIWNDCSCSSWVKNLEFAFRYEEYQNVWVADPANPSHTNAYRTKVFTPGINYYIRGHNAKIQANYNFVNNPDGPGQASFHDTRNDSFVVAFQVMW